MPNPNIEQDVVDERTGGSPSISGPDIEKAVDEIISGSTSTSGPVDERNKPRKAIDAMSWTLKWKIYHTAIPCFLAFLM